VKPLPFGRSIWLLAGVGMLFVLLLALPLLALLLEGAHIEVLAALGNPATVSTLSLSLWTTALSTAIAVLTGTPLAYFLARGRFPGQALLELLVDLPIVLPPSVAGLALLLAFGRQGLLGSSFSAVGIVLPFTTAAVIVAQLFVAGPLFVRSARIGFAAVDRQLEEAAISEGATYWQLFRFVMIPNASPALLSGALLCWARALGEFGATILFAGNLIGRTQTMPLAIYGGLESNREGGIALSIFLLGVSALLLWLLRRFERRWPAA
jgi:molybdate transport system permease protein